MSEPFIPNDSCVQGLPTNQNAIDLIDDWISELPTEVGVKAGKANLFVDARTEWALQKLGGVANQTVLELGPLEGGHTYMLHKAGASITAIEANKRAYLKCLIVKELLNLVRVRLLLGDFTSWLATEPRRFDLVWAAGVLYHMSDPIELLQLIGQHTDRVHIWTHYVPDKFEPTETWAAPILKIENRAVGSRFIPHYIRSYLDLTGQPLFCGGLFTTSAWLRRSDILNELQELGFSRIEIGFETTTHSHGPCFALVAQR